MATYTTNYNLEKPDASDPFGDFRESYNDNLDIIDANLGGGGGSSSLAGLSDVDLTTPTDGQVLTYDGVNSKWVNANGGGGGHNIFFGSTAPTADIGNEADVYIKTSVSISYRIYTVRTGGSNASIAVDTLENGVVVNTDEIPYQNPNRTYPDFTTTYGNPSLNWKVTITTNDIAGYNQNDTITWQYNATKDVTLYKSSQGGNEAYIKHNGVWLKIG